MTRLEKIVIVPNKEDEEMDPIILTKYGDLVIPSDEIKFLRDTSLLLGLPGDHAHLSIEENHHGSFAIFRVSPDWNRMTCRLCNLVVEFPATVKTYGDLRKYFAQQLKPLN